MRCLTVVLALIAASACTSSIAPMTPEWAVRHGLEYARLSGAAFHHRVVSVPGAAARSGTVIVLIGGDGRPFASRDEIAIDPTPGGGHTEVLLRLMPDLATLAPVMYVSRPCYYGEVRDPNCHPSVWTSERYGKAVTASLTAVIRAAVPAEQRVLLVGHSGGGVLAMLVAEQLAQQVIGVVTIASPLDVQAWTDLHHYSPLSGSTDPSANPGRFANACQRHLFGRRDRNVPPDLVESWRWPAAQARFVPSDHACCWREPLRSSIVELMSECRAQSSRHAERREQDTADRR